MLEVSTALFITFLFFVLRLLWYLAKPDYAYLPLFKGQLWHFKDWWNQMKFASRSTTWLPSLLQNPLWISSDPRCSRTASALIKANTFVACFRWTERHLWGETCNNWAMVHVALDEWKVAPWDSLVCCYDSRLVTLWLKKTIEGWWMVSSAGKVFGRASAPENCLLPRVQMLSSVL